MRGRKRHRKAENRLAAQLTETSPDTIERYHNSPTGT